MAVIIKKKARVQEECVVVDKEVLDLVGLSRDKPAEPLKIYSFHKGQRVRVRRKPLTFMKQFEVGDVGVVLETWPAVPEALRILGSKGYGLVRVQLDALRWGTDKWLYFDEINLEPEDVSDHTQAEEL